jgi:polyhydroxybutyrate depolymerase
MATALAILVIAVAVTATPQDSSQTRSGTIEIGGRERSYFVHVPSSYDGKSAVPLVIVLHGALQGAARAERMSGMSELADRENFLVAYPNGTSRFGRGPTWNAGNCCGYALNHNVDDIGFLRALIRELRRDYSVDRKRVYVTGISNGGMMSYRAACELADEIAAIAPVEGAQNVQCSPRSPISVIVFHGTADQLVPFEGGISPYQMGRRRMDTPVAGTVAFWVRQDGCSTTPARQESEEARTDAYSGCKAGTGVTLYAIQGGRHTWPGTRGSGNSVPATEIMWQFFVQHPKP